MTNSKKKLIEIKRREEEFKKNFRRPSFKKPVFIVSAPRSGSSMLFETLSLFPDSWTTGGENHEIIEGISKLHPRSKNYISNSLSELDYSIDTGSRLIFRLSLELRDRNNRLYTDLFEDIRSSEVRFIEKTPKNALRIPFLKALFPDALFIFLYRNPRENIASLIEGWLSKRFIAYTNLPGWDIKEWSFLLVPGWQTLNNSSLAEIAAYQWETANISIINSLEKLPSSSWYVLSYEELIEDQQNTIKKISVFTELEFDDMVKKIISKPFPLSKMTLSPPSDDKWQKYEKKINPLISGLKPIITAIEKIKIKN